MLIFWSVGILQPLKTHCVIAFCLNSPEGKSLDLKKSSYKKLSKFLQAMQDRGLLEVKALSKGVDSVMVIHKDHPEWVPLDTSYYVIL